MGGDKGVFKDIRKRSEKRQKGLHEEESRKELTKVLNQISREFNKKINLKIEQTKNKNPYEYSNGTLTLYKNGFWSKNRRQRSIQEKIILAVVAAKDISKDIVSFEANLLKLISSKDKSDK